VAEIKCANCGAAVPLETEQEFAICPYCNSTLYAGRASSFKEFCFEFIITEKRAESLFRDFMKKMGIDKPPILSKKKVLLPFLNRKKEGAETTRAAFTPHPSFFEDFAIPSGTPVFLPPEAKEWGELVIPDDEAFLFFEQSDGERPSVFHVPFYELNFGIAGNPLKAYVDGVAGKVWCEPFPLTATSLENKRLLYYFIGYFLLFSLVAIVIKSVPAAFAVTLTAAVLCAPFMADLVIRKFK
jgi:DNA-directed RNA polymerase subunit RPC12/RpoP